MSAGTCSSSKSIRKSQTKTSWFLFWNQMRSVALPLTPPLRRPFGGLRGGRAGPILGVSSAPPPNPPRTAVAWLNLYKIISIQSRGTYRGGVMHIYLDAPDLCVHPLIYCNLGARRGTAASPLRTQNMKWLLLEARLLLPLFIFSL